MGRSMGLHAWIRGLLMVGLALATGGCFLHFTLGNVVTVGTIGERVDTVFAAFHSDATIALCDDYSGYMPPVQVKHSPQCTYIIDGSTITTTAELDSELGLFGALVDP